MPDPEIKIRPEFPIESNRPAAQDQARLEALQEAAALGDHELSDWELDLLDSLMMCIEEHRQWTIAQAEKFDELLERYPTTFGG